MVLCRPEKYLFPTPSCTWANRHMNWRQARDGALDTSLGLVRVHHAVTHVTEMSSTVIILAERALIPRIHGFVGIIGTKIGLPVVHVKMRCIQSLHFLEGRLVVQCGVWGKWRLGRFGGTAWHAGWLIFNIQTNCLYG